MQNFNGLLGDQSVHHPGAGDLRIGHRLGDPVDRIGQLIVIQSELVQNGGHQVGHADAVFDSGVAEFVCGSVYITCLQTATGQQQTEAERVVVSACATLRRWQPAKLAGPDDERFV